ncbi:MAG: dockerin type I repeat-containing protein [Candidatus Diapherotrites archaeon]
MKKKLLGLVTVAIILLFFSSKFYALLDSTESEFIESFKCGDANGDGVVSVTDIVWLVNFLFKGGTAPVDMDGADANNDGKVSVTDIVWLVNFLFKGGPTPNCGPEPQPKIISPSNYEIIGGPALVSVIDDSNLSPSKIKKMKLEYSYDNVNWT